MMGGGVPIHLWESFPEQPGRLGAAASTANLLDDVEGHAYGEAGQGTLDSKPFGMGDPSRGGPECLLSSKGAFSLGDMSGVSRQATHRNVAPCHEVHTVPPPSCNP